MSAPQLSEADVTLSNLERAIADVCDEDMQNEISDRYRELAGDTDAEAVPHVDDSWVARRAAYDAHEARAAATYRAHTERCGCECHAYDLTRNGRPQFVAALPCVCSPGAMFGEQSGG